jgi:spermidine/putrescine-binding protein
LFDPSFFRSLWNELNMLTRRASVLFCLFVLALLWGCQRPPQLPPPSGTFPPEAKNEPTLTQPPAPSASSARILAPAGHVPDWLKEQLEKKAGVPVTVDVYATDREAADKLRQAEPVYDLALVSDRIIAPLIKEQKLAALPENLPALKADPQFLHHYFDFTNHYAMPYAWTAVGIAYRAAEVKPEPKKWTDIFSEANLKRTVLPDDPVLLTKLSGRDNVKGALLAPASPEPAPAPTPAPTEPSKSSETVTNTMATAPNAPPVIEPKPQTPPMQVDSIAVLKKKYSGDKAWRFLLPDEGSPIYLYHTVIPAAASAAGPAAGLLEIFFDPANQARLAGENDLAVTRKTAMTQVTPAQAQDLQIYPPDRTSSKFYFIRK